MSCTPWEPSLPCTSNSHVCMYYENKIQLKKIQFGNILLWHIVCMIMHVICFSMVAI